MFCDPGFIKFEQFTFSAKVNNCWARLNVCILWRIFGQCTALVCYGLLFFYWILFYFQFFMIKLSPKDSTSPGKSRHKGTYRRTLNYELFALFFSYN